MESESAPSESIARELLTQIVGKAAGSRVHVAGSYPPCRFIFERNSNVPPPGSL
jgi:hypothetical protein